MKNFTIFLCLVLFTSTINAQIYNGPSKSDLRKFIVSQDTHVPFRLFPTSNLWNFMKLDTRTGQIWMVQYSINSASFTWTLDDSKIEEPISENIGRFTLYPTNNNYNYILLDQFDGRTWQVQYSLDKDSENMRSRIW